MTAPIGGLVVVGASLAGLRAVEAARRAGYDGHLTLVGAEAHLPYDRPPLSKAFLSAGGADAPTFRTEEVLRSALDVDLHLGVRATGLDPDAKLLRTSSGDLAYDGLVIATGTTARRLPGHGDRRGVHTLRTLDDAIAIREALDAGASTVVIGAGFIGSEIASSARARNLEVTIVDDAAVPLQRAVGPMGAVCAALHERHGTVVRCGVKVLAIEGDGPVERVHLDDGTTLTAELVVVGIGATPATDWLDRAVFSIDDGVVCDANLWTGVEGVFAAGDVARWYNAAFGRLMRLEHWTSAAEQGAVAARNALEPALARPYSTVPYFWSDWYGSRLQFVGVPDADEVVVVDGDLATASRWLALYRTGERLTGVLTYNGQADIMKYRALIGRNGTWADGLLLAESRRAKRLATSVADPAPLPEVTS